MKKKRGRKKRESLSIAPTAAEQDAALAHIEALLASPLGQAWIETDTLDCKPIPLPGPKKPGIMASLPRRQLLDQENRSASVMPPMARRLTFEASVLRTFIRLFVWVFAYCNYYLLNLYDRITGVSTLKTQAARLRMILEGLGPTFVKLGQQLSVRADMIPYEYCEELAKMLDKVPPFPIEQAVAAIERVNGKPLADCFAIFDPEPIGSASLACVYQAVLHSGERVAVKVRRPNIGNLLAADLRALGWLMRLSEILTIERPGSTRNIRIELTSMLFEELDFCREARYTDLFRRRARKGKQNYVTAPKVYFELSGEEVLVTEFVSGVFLWEILGCIDREDGVALKALHDRDIDPMEVARRLAMTFNWETMESLLFHADPHPANIVVRPGNEVVFIDFGSCGRFSSKHKRLWKRFYEHLSQEDVNGMVECSILILEPLPPIDLESFTKEVEALYWDWLYAMKSRNVEWWEKATGVMWMKLVDIIRRFEIPMNLDTLRSFRATFLYDTVTFRLWKDLDMDKEYHRFQRKIGKQSRSRVKHEVQRRLKDGLTNEDYQRIEELARMGNQVVGRLQHFLDTPAVNFGAIVDKAAYAITVLLQTIGVVLALHVGAVFVVDAYNLTTGRSVNVLDTFMKIVRHPFYQVVPAIVMLLLIRMVVMRTRDVDVKS